MDWGGQNRMARIFHPKTRRTLMLAVDHGYFLGPTHRLEEPARTIQPLLPHSDAIMLTRGVLRTCVDPSDVRDVAIVLRVSGGPSVIGETLANEDITTAMDDAVRLNAAAVALSIFVGTEYEHKTIVGLARLVDEARRVGMPVLAVTAVGKELEKREARFIALSARIAAEIGADIVKTYYVEDGFEKVVEGTPVPIVIAGGPRLEGTLDALKLAHDVIRKGAAGLDFGRNVWQSDHPVAVIRALRGIVHEGLSVGDANDLFQEAVAAGTRPAARV